jgi:hypothetical protein
MSKDLKVPGPGKEFIEASEMGAGRGTTLHIVTGPRKTELQSIQDLVARTFGKLGCDQCNSGYPRIVIEDYYAFQTALTRTFENSFLQGDKGDIVNVADSVRNKI